MNRKKTIRLLWAGVLLAAGLTACQARTPQPSPLPAETTPAAAAAEPGDDPWEADPGGMLSGVLDQGFSGDGWEVRFWIHPGSGPSPVDMNAAEYGGAVREQFAALDWEQTDLEHYRAAGDDLPGAYGVDFCPKGKTLQVHIVCWSHNDIIRVEFPAGSETECRYLRADGAEELCDSLAVLWPGPEVDKGLVRTSPQETDEATAVQYMEELFGRLASDGHVTGAELRSLAVLPPDPDSDRGADYLDFCASFALQPARPELSYWQDIGVDETGWAEYKDVQVCLWLDERDNRYGLS